MKHLPNVLRYGLLLAIASVLSAPVAAESRTPLPTIVHGKGDKCVQPNEIMRRDHMEFLLHHRDQTMHEGIRTKRYSLTGCIDCHAVKNKQGEYVPVNAPGQFCSSCHSYAAVSVDCFQCHATTPAK
jgi:hypothetical protein